MLTHDLSSWVTRLGFFRACVRTKTFKQHGLFFRCLDVKRSLSKSVRWTVDTGPILRLLDPVTSPFSASEVAVL